MSVTAWLAANTDPVNLVAFLLVAFYFSRRERAIRQRCPYQPDPIVQPEGGDEE